MSTNYTFKAVGTDDPTIELPCGEIIQTDTTSGNFVPAEYVANAAGRFGYLHRNSSLENGIVVCVLMEKISES